MTFVVRIPFVEFEALIWPQGDAPTHLESAALTFLLAFEGGRSLEEITDFLCVGRPAALELVAGLWRRDWVVIDMREGTICLRPTVAEVASARPKKKRFAHLGTAERPERIDLAFDLLTGQVVPGLGALAIDAGDDRDTCGPKPGKAGPFDQPLDGWTDLAPETISAALREHPDYHRLEQSGRESPVVDLPPPKGAIRRDAVRYVRIYFRAQRGLDGSIRLSPSNCSGPRRPTSLNRALDRIGSKIADYLLAEEGPAAEGGPMYQRLEDGVDTSVASMRTPTSARLRLRLEVKKIVEAAEDNDRKTQLDAEKRARALLSELDSELRNRMRFPLEQIKVLPKRTDIDEAMQELIRTPPRKDCANPRFLVTAPSIAVGTDLAKWDTDFKGLFQSQGQMGEGRFRSPQVGAHQRLLAIRWRPARPDDAVPIRRALSGFVRKEGDLKDAQAPDDSSVRDVALVACDGNRLIVSNVSPFSKESKEGCGFSVVFEGRRALGKLEQRFIRGFEDQSKAADLRAAVGGEGRFSVEPPELDEFELPPAPPGGWPQPSKENGDDIRADDEDESAADRRLRAEDWRVFPQHLDEWIAKRPSVELLFDDEIHDEAVAIITMAPSEEPVAVVLSDAVHGIEAELFDALAECASERSAGQLCVWLPSSVSDGLIAEFDDRLHGAIVARLPDNSASAPIAVITRGAGLFAVDGVARRRTGSTARRGLVRLGLALRGPEAAQHVAKALGAIIPVSMRFDAKSSAVATTVGDLSDRLANWRASFDERPLRLGLDVIKDLDAMHVGAIERMESVAGEDIDADFLRAVAKFRAQRKLEQNDFEATRVAFSADGTPECLFMDSLLCEPATDVGAVLRRELLFATTAGVPVRIDSLPTGLPKLLANRETVAALALALMRPDAGDLAYAVLARSLAEEREPAVELIEALTERAMLQSPPSFQLPIEAATDGPTADEIAAKLRGSLSSHRTVDRNNKVTNHVKATLYEQVEDKRGVLGKIEAALVSGGSKVASRVEAALCGAPEVKRRDVSVIKDWSPTAQTLLAAAVKVNQARYPKADIAIKPDRQWLVRAISKDLALAAEWVAAVRSERVVDKEATAAASKTASAVGVWRSQLGEKLGSVETALRRALERAECGEEPVEIQLWRYPSLLTMPEAVKDRNWREMRDAAFAEEWIGTAETAKEYFTELLTTNRFEEADVLLTRWPTPLNNDSGDELKRRLDEKVINVLDDLAMRARAIRLRKTLLGLISPEIDYACREVFKASSDPAPAKYSRAADALKDAEKELDEHTLALEEELRELASHENEAIRTRIGRLLSQKEIGTARAALRGGLGDANGDPLPPILDDTTERTLRRLNRQREALQTDENLPAVSVVALKALGSLAETDNAADEQAVEHAIVALSAALSTIRGGEDLVELDKIDGDVFRFRCISGGLVAAVPPFLVQDNGFVFVTVPRSKEALSRVVDNGQSDDLVVAPRRIVRSPRAPHVDIEDLYTILAQNIPQARADTFSARIAVQARSTASAIRWPGTTDTERATALASFTCVKAADFATPQPPEVIRQFVRRLRQRLGIRFSGDRKRDEFEISAVEDIVTHWAGGLRLNAIEILLRANSDGVIATSTLGSKLRRQETWRPLARRALELAGLPLELGQELIDTFIVLGEDLQIDPAVLSREFGDEAGLSIKGLVERSGLVRETKGGVKLVDAAFLSMLEAGEV